MENAVNKLIQTAKKWNGYLEKKSNKDLDSFTANAGRMGAAVPDWLLKYIAVLKDKIDSNDYGQGDKHA